MKQNTKMLKKNLKTRISVHFLCAMQTLLRTLAGFCNGVLSGCAQGLWGSFMFGVWLLWQPFVACFPFQLFFFLCFESRKNLSPVFLLPPKLLMRLFFFIAAEPLNCKDVPAFPYFHLNCAKETPTGRFCTKRSLLLLLSWARWQAFMPARPLARLLSAFCFLVTAIQRTFFLAGKMKKKNAWWNPFD